MNNKYFLLERILFSQQNIEYNVDKWINSTDGKLFITGYTGSGKSTLAKDIAKKYKCKHVELDTFIEIDKKYVEKLRKENTEESFKKIHYYFKKQTNDAFEKVFKSKEKLVIEGIQIFVYEGYKRFKPHAIIVTGTSALKSFYRAFMRNKDAEWAEGMTWFEIIDDIWSNLYIEHVESFIKMVKEWKNEQ